MPKIRPATAAQAKQAELALAHLQRASVLLRAANAPKTLERCLLTISSAKGALRHLRNRVNRMPQQYRCLSCGLSACICKPSLTEQGAAEAERKAALMALWTHEHSQAAEREGWNIFDLDNMNEDTHIERDDEAGILDSDDDAHLIVMTGTGEHHNAARRIIHAVNLEEWARMDEAANEFIKRNFR